MTHIRQLKLQGEGGGLDDPYTTVKTPGGGGGIDDPYTTVKAPGGGGGGLMTHIRQLKLQEEEGGGGLDDPYTTVKAPGGRGANIQKKTMENACLCSATCHNGHLCKEDICSMGKANPSLFNL